jgi:hypothetical protein
MAVRSDECHRWEEGLGVMYNILIKCDHNVSSKGTSKRHLAATATEGTIFEGRRGNGDPMYNDIRSQKWIILPHMYAFYMFYTNIILALVNSDICWIYSKFWNKVTLRSPHKFWKNLLLLGPYHAIIAYLRAFDHGWFTTVHSETPWLYRIQRKWRIAIWPNIDKYRPRNVPNHSPDLTPSLRETTTAPQRWLEM